MRRELMVFALISFATACIADDTQNPALPASQRAARPRQTPLVPVAGTDNPGDDKAASNAAAPKFSSEAKWVLAGYNNNEIVYTVFVTSQDTRIIRCTTEVKGFYFDNGTKLTIADRQVTTVFPNQPTRVGYWMDMDQESGTTYSVKCHPV